VRLIYLSSGEGSRESVRPDRLIFLPAVPLLLPSLQKKTQWQMIRQLEFGVLILTKNTKPKGADFNLIFP